MFQNTDLQSKIVQEYRKKYQENESVESLEEDIGEEAVESISDIQDEVYRRKETKPRWPVTISFDTNYKRDKGGNHCMFLTYNRDNNEIRFFKDDNAFIVIENDAVKNIGRFFKFCSEIEKECEKKINEGEKYYYEDYLKDKGFMEKEVDFDKLMEEAELLCNKLTKKLRL